MNRLYGAGYRRTGGTESSVYPEKENSSVPQWRRSERGGGPELEMRNAGGTGHGKARRFTGERVPIPNARSKGGVTRYPVR